MKTEGPVDGMVDGPPHSVWKPERADCESAACLPGELRLLHTKPKRGSVVQTTGCLTESCFLNRAVRGNIAVASLTRCDTHTHTHTHTVSNSTILILHFVYMSALFNHLLSFFS